MTAGKDTKLPHFVSFILRRNDVKNKYTFLIIPPKHGPARQFQFSLGGRRILISGFLTFGALILGLFVHNLYLTHTLQVQEAAFQSVNQLKLANQEKDQEIKRLKEESLAMTQDLSRIHELELKISSILKVDTSALLLSRGGTPTPESYPSTGSGDPVQVSTQLTLLEQYHDLVLQNEDQINHTPSILPLEGDHEISSSFGYRRNPFGRWTNEFHNGVDFACDYGTPVHATAAGVIAFAGWDSVYGRRVDIDHGSGIVTFYGHNSSLLVKQGDTVQKGDLIAYSGNSGRSTGSHLHYGALDHGESIDPLRFTDFTKEQ
jgi:murein DD-endopeptidase MepM/ murein hydrolase activator NlpD